MNDMTSRPSTTQTALDAFLRALAITQPRASACVRATLATSEGRIVFGTWLRATLDRDALTRWRQNRPSPADLDTLIAAW
ncbi:MAG TPA: hypothetical protein VF808_14450 [Ktedonobacterales bacterium]